MDAQLAAEIAFAVAAVVGLLKPKIEARVKDPAQEKADLRILSAVLGVAFALGAVLTLPGAHISPNTVLDVAAQGFGIGTGATLTVKGFHASQDLAPTLLKAFKPTTTV